MLELDSTSRIGFGAYRVSVESREHKLALIHALRCGCNLIDTSTSYMNGKSETLIGEVGAEFPEFETFVVTKAGYAQGDDLRTLEELNERGLAREGVVSIAHDFKYSIHPDFLRRQIALSLERLRRRRIDAFLLHNPEHYYEQRDAPASADEYYSRIRAAFEFLEDMVRVGIVRYFGISSNTFPLSTDDPATTDLRRVLEIAEAVSTRHHFKIIEFPFNLLETSALQPNHGGSTLLDVARASGLVTCANRPLNAKGPHGPVRLATYEGVARDRREPADSEIFGECVERVARQLRQIGSRDDPMDFTVMQFLRDSWMRIGDPELVTQIFHGRLYPFLDRLYGGAIGEDDAAAFRNLQRHATVYSRELCTLKARTLRLELEQQGVVAAGDARPLAVISAAHAFECGIDRVLVGMRRTEYVEGMRSLF